MKNLPLTSANRHEGAKPLAIYRPCGRRCPHMMSNATTKRTRRLTSLFIINWHTPSIKCSGGITMPISSTITFMKISASNNSKYAAKSSRNFNHFIYIIV